MTGIEIKNVSFTYLSGTPFEKEALSDVCLKIKPDNITGIIGHTGSGKSTLVQMFNGLLKPTSGTILLNGTDIWSQPKKMRELRFKVGLVFQYPEYQLFEETLRKDIAFGPRNMGLDEDEIKKRVDEAALFTNLDASLLDKSPFELSGGQKRRAAIAGVMAMRPEVLVLDEPAAGLDPIGREEILGGVYRYQRRTGSSVIIVSHSMEDMARYSDEIVVLNKGSVYMQGKTSDIFRRSGELIGVGLDIPQITRLIYRLKKAGLELDDDIFTVEKAVDALLPLLSEGGGE